MIGQEITEMLSRGAISVAKNLEGQFLSSLPLIEKKDAGGGGESPSNQSEKKLNKMLPYAHFKMEILFLLKEILLPGEFCARSI